MPCSVFSTEQIDTSKHSSPILKLLLMAIKPLFSVTWADMKRRWTAASKGSGSIPNLGNGYESQAYALSEHLGKLEEALALYDLALQYDFTTNRAAIYGNKGMALSLLGRLEEALTCCEQALHLDREEATVYHATGVVPGKLGRYEEAFSCLDLALCLRPWLAEAYNDRGHIHHQVRQYEEALKDYDQALRLKSWLADAPFFKMAETLLMV
jgi:tetratricopeptide (TPR) repeat protein